MASNTYVALKTTTVGSGVTTFDMTSIPSGYTDLILVANAATTATGQYIALRFNSDSGTNYSDTVLEGNGSSATSNRESNLNRVQMVYQRGTDSTFGTVEWHIQNYSNSTTYKTVLGRWNYAGDGVTAGVSLWRNTNAITSITVLTSGTFVSGSTFTLYGITAASVGAKATGGTIYQDASYFYHVFAANGTFTPSQSISADVLVVAGGGGGGGNAGGGGGAGGLAYYAAQSLTATGYTCTVGSGGTKGTTNTVQATQGGNSTFGALTSAVGGGYGSYTGSGGSGGSGGGSRAGTGAVYSGGTATSGQGNAGGANSGSAPNYGGGGGGGAGAVGAAGTGSSGGNGGVGLSTYSSWGLATGFGQNVSGTVYFAGGGGGGIYDVGTYGTGGYGGGGNAGTNNVQNAVDGTANTGGGGGGASGTSPSTNGGNGGSGVVIVRYAK